MEKLKEMRWSHLQLLVLCAFIIFEPVISVTNSTENVEEEIPDTYANLTDNSLWKNLLTNCKKPTIACIQKYSYEYLNETLNTQNDIRISNIITLSKNNLNFTYNNPEEEDEDDLARSSPIGEIMSDLQGQTVQFLMKHDINLQLPEILFEGATVKLSPRSLEGNGALVKLEILPKDVSTNGDARIFKKKIKKFFSGKLISAFLAILLVVKLVKVLLMFFMPLVMGAAAAKKLILKVILFIFPAMSYLFKLCPYYSHGTKFHHHQHQIKHIHHIPPSLHHTIELDHTPHYSHHDDDFGYYSEGPGVSHDFHTHRKGGIGPNRIGEDKEVPWKQGQGQHDIRIKNNRPFKNGPLSPSEIENMLVNAEKEVILKNRLQEEQKRIQAENKILQDQLRKALKLQEKLKLQAQLLNQNVRVPQNFIQPPAAPNSIILPANVPPPAPSPYLQTPVATSSVQTNVPQQVLSAVQKTSLHTQAILPTTSPAASLIDPFYSPILLKIDKILVGLGFNEEGCRERLICSMYKNPTRFSPHSNLLSAELSRDSSELQKPTNSNIAVVRFYRYVQAARDGQDKRDCLRLYPTCTINTET